MTDAAIFEATPQQHLGCPKVTIQCGDGREMAGHLTDVSCAILIVELRYRGYEIVKRRDGECND